MANTCPFRQQLSISILICDITHHGANLSYLATILLNKTNSLDQISLHTRILLNCLTFAGANVWCGWLSRNPVSAGNSPQLAGSLCPRRGVGHHGSVRCWVSYVQCHVYALSATGRPVSCAGSSSAAWRSHGTLHRTSTGIYLYVLY